MKLPFRIFIGFILIALACGNNRNPVDSAEDADFGLYFLKNDALSVIEVLQRDLSSLELQTEPWLSEKDIVRYDFSSHYIYLKYTKTELLKDYLGSNFTESNLESKPFVVMANQERCYLGSFYPTYLSTGPATPYISIIFLYDTFIPADVIPIEAEWITEDDKRDQEALKNALSNLNLLHLGLEVKLNSVTVVSKSDTTTVRYSYTLTNHDSDALFVIDPDKMGSERFHYFTNGVHFRSDQEYYYSQYKKTIASENGSTPNPQYYCRIKSGGSVTKTVELKGYPKIPGGRYECYFNFNNPTRIDRASRETPNGRYWLGSVTSDKIKVTIN